ncbi:class I SAM-dependent rRNA methyltransferase [Geotoga petraea]|jgi:23S rRNA (cytosine1962-C5)-methyltransferase|uniref:23S rRNA (Cytosine1962-C5)-methyltransferase n=1 Tax=Geotoga petraea TaxID=28234 RepID=A0A1G6JKH5_9BACT|nr:class I SAM-dependent rRNA methyltransferase [Geotoga petraea]MDK2945391.1 rRNA (cytosine1962-C5)-methyltransferase [Geotoga sp.]TGG88248.1 class I SAM-dependent rRNA methyltransferase [Geotoga petraea]SDC19249.1 23S rRNA (cytosine1962-C5)-methyltransferase [Geotoga petraea]
MIIVRLNKNKEKKIINLYPRVFKDEIFEIQGEKIEGEICNVFSNEYQFLGKGFYSEGNIAVKMLSTKDVEINEEFFKEKIFLANKKRSNLKNSYRLFHAEADGIPGLIIDKYLDYIIIQIRNKGLENYKNYIIEALKDIINPKSIYERSDFESKVEDKIERNVGHLYGEEIPEEIEIEEHGIKYIVNPKKGQKTGFFFDQRDSRKFVRELVKKDSLALDGHTFTGGFAMNMSKAGANKIIAIDKDEDSLQIAKKNACLNNIDNIEYVNSTYENYMKEYEGEKFDIMVLDPPSLIKKKHERKKGVDIFKNIVELAKPHLKDEGIIGLCSCAYHADTDLLIEATRKAYFGEQKLIQFIGVTFQSNDHPWIIQIPESLYLKCLWMKIINL